ncbi:MAG: fibronectin type III domain-containing protein [Chlorobi bacterium OLB5]|nr:MAG: fibronectin type III domain-containing protein [Chlorobi bacterium OLB5]
MKKAFPILSLLAVGLFFIGLISSDPFGSRTNVSNDNAINPVVPQTDAVVKFADSMNAVNDEAGLRTRGWKPKRGPLHGPIGSTFFFQGNATVFPAFEGPTTGYVGANFNATTGSNTIDLWLISPVVNGAAGDTISFYERSPTGSTFPDSIRVHWASNGDTVPGSGSWVELGKFKTTTTGTWAERRFVLPSAGATGRFAINYRVANGGPSGVNSDYIGLDLIRLLGPAAGPSILPDVLYYKFEQNPAPLLTPNCAIPPAGTNPAPVQLHTLGSGGQFDSCLVGIGTTNARIATGWNCNLANGSWTISFWVNNLVDMNPTYLFGDAGSTSFRCFYGGAAGVNNILLRGPMTDILIPCPAGPQVFHMVYDGTNVIIYRNGALISTNPRAINMPTGTGFYVGGYSSGFGLSGRMDEFRLIRRALTPAEVAAQWNSDLGGCGLVGITQNNNQIPNLYSLSQNYPNPFNPVTNIKFALPNTGLVKLVVFDILGREVSTLVNEVRTAGNYTVDFDASSLSSGVYFYRIESGNFTDTKKMLLVK